MGEFKVANCDLKEQVQYLLETKIAYKSISILFLMFEKAIDNITELESKIFIIRGLTVMLDSDLATLYNVETKVLNQTVKRNIDRFPEIFMFQITEWEWDNLRSQFVTSSSEHGGKRYFPHVFTEQGVAMLSAVLKSKTAINVSIQIMTAFVSLRRNNNQISGLHQRVDNIEKKQLEHEIKFDNLFSALEKADRIPEQGIFFDGQIFDAYVFVSNIIKKAKQSIILIDNYIDETTLTLLNKRNKKVDAMIYTKLINPTLMLDIKKHNEQYPPIQFNLLKNNHDRFLIIDKLKMYHMGASLKDLGK